jgi:hypothetical protein
MLDTPCTSQVISGLVAGNERYRLNMEMFYAVLVMYAVVNFASLAGKYFRKLKGMGKKIYDETDNPHSNAQ